MKSFHTQKVLAEPRGKLQKSITSEQITSEVHKFKEKKGRKFSRFFQYFQLFPHSFFKIYSFIQSFNYLFVQLFIY